VPRHSQLLRITPCVADSAVQLINAADDPQEPRVDHVAGRSTPLNFSQISRRRCSPQVIASRRDFAESLGRAVSFEQIGDIESSKNFLRINPPTRKWFQVRYFRAGPF
jgi:hypothetical protein